MRMPRRRTLFSLLFFVVVIFPTTSYSIPIDDFVSAQTLASNVNGETKSSVVSNPGSLGGTRKLLLTIHGTSAGALISPAAPPNVFSLQALNDSSGTASLIWDNNSVSSRMDPRGLGGAKLNPASEDRFNIRILNFNFENQKSVTLTITVYEYNPTGAPTVYADRTITLDRAYSNKEVSFPFSGLVPHNKSLFDFYNNVGAIQLVVNGQNGSNIIIDCFETSTGEGNCSESRNFGFRPEPRPTMQANATAITTPPTILITPAAIIPTARVRDTFIPDSRPISFATVTPVEGRDTFIPERRPTIGAVTPTVTAASTRTLTPTTSPTFTPLTPGPTIVSNPDFPGDYLSHFAPVRFKSLKLTYCNVVDVNTDCQTDIISNDQCRLPNEFLNDPALFTTWNKISDLNSTLAHTNSAKGYTWDKDSMSWNSSAGTVFPYHMTDASFADACESSSPPVITDVKFYTTLTVAGNIYGDEKSGYGTTAPLRTDGNSCFDAKTFLTDKGGLIQISDAVVNYNLNKIQAYAASGYEYKGNLLWKNTETLGLVSAEGLTANPCLGLFALSAKPITINPNVSTKLTVNGLYSDQKERVVTSGITWSKESGWATLSGNTVTGVRPGSTVVLKALHSSGISTDLTIFVRGPTPTPTGTPTKTYTPSITPTNTKTYTPSLTPTNTVTPTASSTQTFATAVTNIDLIFPQNLIKNVQSQFSGRLLNEQGLKIGTLSLNSSNFKLMHPDGSPLSSTEVLLSFDPSGGDANSITPLGVLDGVKAQVTDSSRGLSYTAFIDFQDSGAPTRTPTLTPFPTDTPWYAPTDTPEKFDVTTTTQNVDTNCPFAEVYDVLPGFASPGYIVRKSSAGVSQEIKWKVEIPMQYKSGYTFYPEQFIYGRISETKNTLWILERYEAHDDLTGKNYFMFGLLRTDITQTNSPVLKEQVFGQIMDPGPVNGPVVLAPDSFFPQYTEFFDDNGAYKLFADSEKDDLTCVDPDPPRITAPPCPRHPAITLGALFRGSNKWVSMKVNNGNADDGYWGIANTDTQSWPYILVSKVKKTYEDVSRDAGNYLGYSKALVAADTFTALGKIDTLGATLTTTDIPDLERHLKTSGYQILQGAEVGVPNEHGCWGPAYTFCPANICHNMNFTNDQLCAGLSKDDCYKLYLNGNNSIYSHLNCDLDPTQCYLYFSTTVCYDPRNNCPTDSLQYKPVTVYKSLPDVLPAGAASFSYDHKSGTASYSAIKGASYTTTYHQGYEESCGKTNCWQTCSGTCLAIGFVGTACETGVLGGVEGCGNHCGKNPSEFSGTIEVNGESHTCTTSIKRKRLDIGNSGTYTEDDTCTLTTDGKVTKVGPCTDPFPSVPACLEQFIPSAAVYSIPVPDDSGNHKKIQWAKPPKQASLKYGAFHLAPNGIYLADNLGDLLGLTGGGEELWRHYRISNVIPNIIYFQETDGSIFYFPDAGHNYPLNLLKVLRDSIIKEIYLPWGVKPIPSNDYDDLFFSLIGSTKDEFFLPFYSGQLNSQIIFPNIYTKHPIETRSTDSFLPNKYQINLVPYAPCGQGGVCQVP
jgi:hypothetical protein